MNPSLLSIPNRRWMLVDDNPEILTMMCAIAETFTNATVECHDSAQSALAAFAESPGHYELVITDYEMPGMDGLEFCRRIRTLAPDQKVFLVTGSGVFSETAAGHCGFNALLNKPFPLGAFQNALAHAGVETTSACAA